MYEEIVEITDDHNVVLSSDKDTLERVKTQMLDALENMLDEKTEQISHTTKNGKINKNSSFNKTCKNETLTKKINSTK